MLKLSRTVNGKTLGSKGNAPMNSHLYMNHPGHAIQNPQHGKFTKVKINEGFIP